MCCHAIWSKHLKWYTFMCNRKIVIIEMQYILETNLVSPTQLVQQVAMAHNRRRVYLPGITSHIVALLRSIPLRWNGYYYLAQQLLCRSTCPMCKRNGCHCLVDILIKRLCHSQETILARGRRIRTSIFLFYLTIATSTISVK